MNEMTGQWGNDARAFAGKGEAARRMRQCEKAVEELHRRMRELSGMTRQIPNRAFYLEVHRRAATGQLALRWRHAGARGGHIPWREVQALFRQWPQAMAQWYAQANRMACDLNGEERGERARLRQIKEELLRG